MNIDDAPIAEQGNVFGVPVIDMSGDRNAIFNEIGQACAVWGFFQIVGHGIDSRLISRVMAETRALFSLPKTELRALSRSRDNPWGYYDRELTKNARDKKEIFDIGPSLPSASAQGDPFVGSTPWPKRATGFESTMRAYFAACEEVATRIIAAIAFNLGAPDLLRAFEPADTSFLRLNYYPTNDPLGDEVGDGADLGVHHHTDAGALTVLLQDGVSGLEVFRDGFWHPVTPLRDALVINIGDMLQVWSNDRYLAPIHRVRAMDDTDRYSIPFFYNPCYDAVVVPAALEVCGPAHYSGIPWGSYRRRRADGDFADGGDEVQISHFRLSSRG
jgi:isopenicillin N synthase-like dioxygenase